MGSRFNPPLQRMREYVEIINTIMKGEPLTYSGKLFDLQRGFTLRFQPVRAHIPIYLATINAKSVKMTAELADGWLPILIPLEHLKSEIDNLRQASVAVGRPTDAVAVRSPGTITVTPQVDKARAASAAMLAFYIGRMGTFYAAQLTRLGYGETVETVKKAWAGGSRAAAETVPAQLVDATGCVGSVEAGINRLQAQEECGVDLHHVNVQAENNTEYERILTKLVG